MNIVSSSNKDLDSDKLDEIKYGLEGIYLSITKIIVILGLSAILGCLKECIFITLLFNILRFSGFGIHASKSWMCWVSSSIVFLGMPIVCKYLVVDKTISILICLFCIISFLLFAPADTIKRPLVRKKKRLIYKSVTVFTALVFSFLALRTSNNFVHNALLGAMLIEVVLIHPLTYLLFKLSYNNYKTYVFSTEEGKKED